MLNPMTSAMTYCRYITNIAMVAWDSYCTIQWLILGSCSVKEARQTKCATVPLS